MPDLLARELTKPCHPASDDALRQDNAYYCCIASSVCGWTLKAWDRNLPRIYKHAGQCRALCNWRPALFQRAKSALASMAPSRFGEPDANVQDHSSPNDLTALHELPAPNPFLSYSHMGSMTLQDQLNHAVAALICASGAPAQLIDYPEWTHYSRLLNPNYTPPKSNYIRDRIIPAEARRAVLHMQEHLQEIGPHWIASIVLDNTATTKKAQQEALGKYLWILNLANPIHKFNLCIQDICQDPIWQEIVAEALDETTVTALKFQQDLKELVNILEPFACALLCLESTRSSLSDVYFFWLGALAALDHHFKSQNCLLLPQDWGRLRCIALKRFNKAINDAPTDGYVTAFFLDPRYHDVAIYASSNACSCQATVPPPVDCPQTSNPQQLNKCILNCVQKQLFAMLKAELEAAKDIPHHPLHAYSQDALVAKEQLHEQLDCYYWADQRFLSQYLTPNQSAL
ncbi:hypothetical protein RHS04_00101 [Rhizoctonia solani]|uniref:Uncharacterized protein n=1 Tax=Rhizoctonia solani TaxID=456999 RepID=A0A8H7HHW5_9AGAM|nr:hypothetical protein RHS04_00101 [Rhizoctonia solani]